MRLNKTNIAGLISARQRSEMKSILAGTWPPLKPLPVFKYETVACRATIDFDKLRGEWVCRKTSFPSNNVQELRGGLREITMALPTGAIETFDEHLEQQELELEKDTIRRLQAIHDWRENSENGARYFELREYLSESQRTEIDDSLRLSLTARQLQFNAKNVAYVFDALSAAGGRFATLIEFAKRNKAKLRTTPMVQETAPEAEPKMDHDKFPPEFSPRESDSVLSNNFSCVGNQEAGEPCIAELPALSIKNVLPEQDASFLANRMEHTASQEFERAPHKVAEEDSAFLVEQSCQKEYYASVLNDFREQARMDRSEDRTPGSSSRLPALEISALQVVAFALLILFSVAAFTIGLTVGRGPLGRRLLGASQATSAIDSLSPTRPAPADESASKTLTPLLAIPIESAGATNLNAAAKTIESQLLAQPEVTSERVGTIGSRVSDAPPPATSNAPPSRNAVVPMSSAPRSPASYGSIGTLGVAPHLSRPSTILVNVPIRGNQPFRVTFPEKAIAATPSLAMTSQLSVFLSPEARPIEADRPARLEAGQLVSLVWPRYPKPADRYGGAEVIKVRATIGPLGQVREVSFLSGSRSLLSATTRALRQWRYTPTLLDKKPIQSQQDLTIEFRPGQYSARASGSHPHHN